ncbi:MAG: RHS repeat-associated core domain-containing protein [Acidobacteriota bacterium]|nr:RHS repeat-associated core domain-containing protein [Acidobacteriota bacterium]
METVSMQGGGLMLNFPLASLPQGRGESGGAISLSYSSKIWDPQAFRMDNGCADPHCNTRLYKNFTFVYPSQSGGGWNYALFYRLEQFNQDTEDRSGPRPDRCANGENTSSNITPDPYVVRQRMRMPDGSTVDFREENEWDVNGYFRRDMAGRQYYCVPPNGVSLGYLAKTAPTYQPKTYFSTDGSRLRLDISYTAPNEFNGRTLIWKLYYPDGSRVEGTSQDGFENITDTSLPYSIRNEHYDRNGNRVVTEKIGTTVKISDSVGREIKINNLGSTEEQIISAGTGGETIEWRVKWKWISIDANRIRPSGDYWGGTIYGSSQIKVVEQIISPAQMGSQVYTFEYNHDLTGTAQGTGELSAVNFPTGARTEYSYDTDGQTNLTTGKMLGNYLTRKKMIYQTEGGEPTDSITEVWKYYRERVFDFQTGMPRPTYLAKATGPDGGQTTETYNFNPYDARVGRLQSRTAPDGTMTENVWAVEPTVTFSSGGSTNYNPYLKAELVWLKDAAGNVSKARLKDYSYDQNGNVTQSREYDWIPANSITRNQAGEPQLPPDILPLRVTNNIYFNPTSDASSADTSSAYIYRKNTSPALKKAVASTEISDGSGNVKSRTEFTYDNYSTTGNVISVKNWDSWKNGSYQPYSSPLTTANSISSATTYNQYGSPVTVTDSNGNIAQITYGAITGPNNTTISDLYPTQTISASGTAAQRTNSSEYDFYTGLVTKTTDVDNDVSNAVVYDALGRPVISKTAIDTPLEIWTQIEYNAQLRRIITRSDLETKGDGKKVTVQHYDPLGKIRLTRTLENIAAEDPTNEQHGIKVQVRYKYDDPTPNNPDDIENNNGIYSLSSNPYRGATPAQAANEESMGWSVSYTDKTRRHSEARTFSGATLPAPWGNNTNSTGVSGADIEGDRTLATDQAGKKRISKVNGLGQLISIWEVKEPDADTENIVFGNPAVSLSGLKTTYSYDALNNLTVVNQGVQQRTFAYTSLSRMLSASSPEAGTVSYQYDNNGNLTQKTDARSVVALYTYDALNRPLTRSYSAPPNTPNYENSLPVSYTYDNLPNAKGKLTKIVTGNVSTPFSVTEYQAFDKLGRVTQSRQIVEEKVYNSTFYKYNLSGGLVEQTYPSGRVVKNIVDDNGDLSSVQSKKNQNSGFWSYASHFTYTATGQISSVQLGNGRWEHTQFNSRLQPVQIALGKVRNAADLLKLDYSYGTWENGMLNQEKNNGNVAQQIITVPTIGNNAGFTATQTYTYDALNRIKQATETIPNQTGWQQTFTYDRYGNRNFDEPNTTTLPQRCGAAPNPTVCPNDPAFNPTINIQNNRPNGYLFDNAGNTTRDAQNRKFTYDSENRQVRVETVDARGNVVNTLGQYFYDGDGRRVKKIVPAMQEITIFLYDASAKLIMEYSTAQPPQIPQVSYTTNDHLGSPRINTNQQGDVMARHDYQPFGEEIQRASYGSDDIRKQFTGYERDKETNLDFAQARYYNSDQGRFSSPDPYLPSAVAGTPQSWNRYAYVLNRPFVYVDPDGEDWVKTEDKSNPYKWVDKCGDGQKDCYKVVSAGVGNSLRVYGSKDAKDITDFDANKHGMVDMREVAEHHDAEFIVKPGAKEAYLNTRTGSALFNVASEYSQLYPGDEKLMMTAGSLADGTSLPIHTSHKQGNNIDLRYMGEDGKTIQSPRAVELADVERTKKLAQMFKQQNAGLDSAITGNPPRFDLPDIQNQSIKNVHKNHMHFQRNYPKTVLERPGRQE